MILYGENQEQSDENEKKVCPDAAISSAVEDRSVGERWLDAGCGNSSKTVRPGVKVIKRFTATMEKHVLETNACKQVS